MVIEYPIKKNLIVNGVNVELIKLKPDGEVGAKIFVPNDAVGLNIYKYICREGMLDEKFLLTIDDKFANLSPS